MAPTVFLLRRTTSDIWKWNVGVCRWAARLHPCSLTRRKCVTAPPAGHGQLSADSSPREVGLLLLTPKSTFLEETPRETALRWGRLGKESLLFRNSKGTCLVVQWLRIRLATQGTQVRSLVREDPTCQGAPKPRRCNYGACVPQLGSLCAAMKYSEWCNEDPTQPN